MEEKSHLYTPPDVIERMREQLLNGKVKGTSTYNDEIDKCWTWRTREANIWTGYANEGKSLFLKQMALIKALEEDKKFLFNAPEDFPPEEFFDDMIHTLVGQTTDRDYANCVDLDTYNAAYELIRDKFLFHYVKPPKNTVERVLSEFRDICEGHDIYACVMDPLLKFARPKGYERDDIYASYIGSLAIDFCRETNTSFHLVMHQLTPQMDTLSKKYPEPNMYRVKGGGSWSDGFDNVLSVWRPNYATDKLNTEVQFASQKIKKQKLVGIPQKIKIAFDRRSNRYIEFGTDNRPVPLFNFDKFIPRKKQPVFKISQ